MRYDAIVIGAGPAGGTAALMLARAGWSVAIVEKNSFPRRKVCGEFISATSLPLLRELGLLDEFLQRAGPDIRRVGLFARDVVMPAPMPQPHGADRWGHALGREHLDQMILEAARREGAVIWQPWRASALSPTRNGYLCAITAGQSFQEHTAPVIIAAHGSWETGELPTQAGTRHRPTDLLGFKAHFREGALPADLMPLLAFPGGYGGMVTTDGGRVSLSCCIRRDTLRECRERMPRQRAADAVLHHIRASCAGVRDALKTAALDRGWLSAGPIRPGIRTGYADGIFRVGNCAGEAHPIVAEGISMAMQSAALLCRLLIARRNEAIAGRALAKIGSAYQAEWQRLFALRIHAAALFAHAAMWRPAAGLMLPVVKNFPQILTGGAQLAGKARI